MKINALLMFSALVLSFQSMAQNSAFETAMTKQLEAIPGSQSPEAILNLVNNFERISEKESAEWLPDYYAAKLLADASFRVKDVSEKDKYIDRAEAFIAKAKTKNGDPIELSILEGYALMARLSADPMTRGQELSPKVMQTFAFAVQKAPENPRALLMLGQMEYGTAQFFGTGTEKACAYVKRSLELFEKQPKSGIDPSWGREMAEAMLKQCL